MESPSSQAHSVKTTYASPTTTPNNTKKENEPSYQPSQLELDMLKDIVGNPFDGVVKRIKRLGVSRRKGTAALNALEARGLTKSATFYTGNGMLKLFDLSKEGRGLCHSQDFGPLPDPTEGGAEHRYWVRYVETALLSANWRTRIEYGVSTGLTVDVHAEKDDQILAVLVETGHSDVKGNISKAIQAGYSKVWVISNNPKVRCTVDRMLNKRPSSADIRFLQPNNILDEEEGTALTDK